MSGRPEILFLVHRVPFPPNRGDRIRSYHMLKFLAARAKVSLATLADEPLEQGTREELNRLCDRVAIEQLPGSRWFRAAASLLSGRSATEGLFASTGLKQTLDSWTRETRYDAVVVFCSSMVQFLKTPRLAQVPAIVDLVDVDSQKFFDYGPEVSFAKRCLYRLEGSRLRCIERSLAGCSHAVTLVSEAEADVYRSICPDARTLAVENGVNLDYFQPQGDEPMAKHCVFVGAMDYFPNASCMQWFCTEVWPDIIARHPSATLSIVGRSPPLAVSSLAALSGVEVTGTVPDVRPHVARATVVVAPLKIARGVQNKVLEAMAMGKPVVTSPQALQGLHAQPELELLEATSPAEWVNQICRTFDNPQLCHQLATAARSYVETHHSWAAKLRALGGLLDEIVPDRSSKSSPATTQPSLITN